MTLLAPLSSVDAYVDHFSRQPLPVLRNTAQAMTALADGAAQASSKALSSLAFGDPLLATRVLAHLQSHRPPSRNADINTIEQAVMMMGIEPFLHTFGTSTTVESLLAAQPQALLGALRVIARARRAASLARTLAIMRHDLDAQEIAVAALLSETTEIVCWLHAPALTGKVYALQQARRQLRSAVAQRHIFGVTAAELQLGLVRAWGLPELLVQLLDHRLQDDRRVKTVTLAVRTARHLARGWDDPALPDDIAALEALVRVPRGQLLRRLGTPPSLYARFGLDPASECDP